MDSPLARSRRRGPSSLHRRLWGQQVWIDVAASVQARAARRPRRGSPPCTRRARSLGPRDRIARQLQLDLGALLASPIRASHAAISILPKRRPQAVRDLAGVPYPWVDRFPTRWPGGRLPLCSMQQRESRASSTAGQGDVAGGSWRRVPLMRVRPVSRRAPISSLRPGAEAVPTGPPWCYAVALRPSGGGEEVRATLRQLPRRGGGWSRQPASISRAARSGVAQW